MEREGCAGEDWDRGVDWIGERSWGRRGLWSDEPDIPGNEG